PLRVAREERGRGDGLVRRIEIDEVVLPCVIEHFREPTCPELHRFQRDAGRTQVIDVEYGWVGVLADRDIEPALPVDAVQSVEACLVEIDESCRAGRAA